ncbi:unnamed protein product [Symbiodinium sp. CCMP2456]|nr:unnamed protein product [Symbiodinium sp. CCMP2456]
MCPWREMLAVYGLMCVVSAQRSSANKEAGGLCGNAAEFSGNATGDQAALMQAKTVRVGAQVMATTRSGSAEVSFSEVVEYRGKYCYAPADEKRADYRVFDGLSSQQECEDYCATDPECNFYGWYTGRQTGSRCDDCVLYTACDARRESVCKDVDNPKIYQKSPLNTGRVPSPAQVKVFEPDEKLTDMYCKDSEIVALDRASLEECKSNCSRFSDCWYLAYYHNSRPDEDARASSCNPQCRLFSRCNHKVNSMCRPGPTVFAAITTTTTTTTSSTTTTVSSAAMLDTAVSQLLVTSQAGVYRCPLGSRDLGLSSCVLVAAAGAELTAPVRATEGPGTTVLVADGSKVLRCDQVSQAGPQCETVVDLQDDVKGVIFNVDARSQFASGSYVVVTTASFGSTPSFQSCEAAAVASQQNCRAFDNYYSFSTGQSIDDVHVDVLLRDIQNVVDDLFAHVAVLGTIYRCRLDFGAQCQRVSHPSSTIFATSIFVKGGRIYGLRANAGDTNTPIFVCDTYEQSTINWHQCTPRVLRTLSGVGRGLAIDQDDNFIVSRQSSGAPSEVVRCPQDPAIQCEVLVVGTEGEPIADVSLLYAYPEA